MNHENLSKEKLGGKMKKIIKGIKKAIKNIWAWIKMAMKKIWNLIKIIAEWIWIFIKKVWLGTVGVALWLSASFIIYKQTDLLISDKIQAWAIVTLVFVTLYYARQTHNLVKEEKKRGQAECGERYIQNFYNPLKIKLRDLELILEQPDASVDSIIELRHEIVDLVSRYIYVITGETDMSLRKLIKNLNRIMSSNQQEKKLNELRQEIKEGLYEAVNNIIYEAVIAGVAIREAHENFVEKGIKKYKLREGGGYETIQEESLDEN